MLTANIVTKITPDAKADLVAALLWQKAACGGEQAINTALRMAHFVARTGHEPRDFTTAVENRNYRVRALTATPGTAWIPAAWAAQFGRNDAAG